MPLEEVIAGFTGTGFTTLPPVIPGLQALGIFGSGKDGKNTNRVSGGPTFTNLTQAPTIGTSWITVNTGSSTTKGYDTGVVETGGIATAGWTWFCIARFLSGTGNFGMMNIGAVNALGFIINPANNQVSNHPSFYVAGVGLGAAADNTFDLGAGVNQTLWRMYALSWLGGSNNFYTLHDVTGNASKTTTVPQTRAGNAACHMTIGNNQGAGNTGTTAVGDVAFAGISTSILSLSDLRTIRTWALGVESVRSVTGF